MWSRTLKYIYSIALVLLLAFPAFAQVEEDTVTVERPKVHVPLSSYAPTGVRVGTDLITDIKGYTQSNASGYELNADIDFYRYFLTIDYGKREFEKEIQNGWYQNDGRYWRIGVDVNFLSNPVKNPDKNMLFLGLRYGHALFTDSVSYIYSTSAFGDRQTSILNEKVRGSWAEITSGLRVKIWKFFWMGYTFRIKLIPRMHGDYGLTPFDIPGYGYAGAKTYWGFNYQLFFRLPLKKKT